MARTWASWWTATAGTAARSRSATASWWEAGENIGGGGARRVDTVGVDRDEDDMDEPVAVELDVSRREGGTNGLSVDRLWW